MENQYRQQFDEIVQVVQDEVDKKGLVVSVKFYLLSEDLRPTFKPSSGGRNMERRWY